ncbi:MAG: DUF2914 domain-containing protein [Candidatus Krumholzibacteriia bacterium]
MKYPMFVLVFLFMLSGTVALAQEAPGLTVEEMVFCAAVQDRAPSLPDTAFASTIENVWCFVKVTGAADTTAITQVWYYDDREMSRVELAVKSARWRTWSSKKILPEWQGIWRVDVLSPGGEVLKSGSFAVKP